MGEPTAPEGVEVQGNPTLEDLAEKGAKPELTPLQKIDQAKEALRQAHREALTEFRGVVDDASGLGRDVVGLLPVESSGTEDVERSDGSNVTRRTTVRRGDLVAPDGSHATFAVNEVDDFPAGSQPGVEDRDPNRGVYLRELIVDAPGGRRVAVEVPPLGRPRLGFYYSEAEVGKAGMRSAYALVDYSHELDVQNPSRAPRDGMDILATARERVSYLSDHKGELTVPAPNAEAQVAPSPAPAQPGPSV